MHELVNVQYNSAEKKKLRKWSGQCTCNRWNGMGPNQKKLKDIWKETHLRSLN